MLCNKEDFEPERRNSTDPTKVTKYINTYNEFRMMQCNVIVIMRDGTADDKTWVDKPSNRHSFAFTGADIQSNEKVSFFWENKLIFLV